MSNNNDPLAAALAAAAALAQNGGTFLYECPTSLPVISPKHEMIHSPSKTDSSPIISTVASSEEGNVNGENDALNENARQGNEENISNRIGPEDDTESTNDEDAKRRMARSRERNREHARRTRRRKKAQLEALQSKVQSLHVENQNLQQSLEECRIASILVGFSVSDGDDRDGTIQKLLKEAAEIERNDIFKKMTAGKRGRFVSDASDIATETSSSSSFHGNSFSMPLKIVIDGNTTIIGGDSRSHLNWKTGVYTDENGGRLVMTNQQLEALRRERNRMHAKMTRDRKKSFIAAIEKTIAQLESSNNRMKAILKDVHHFSKPPLSSSNDLTKNRKGSYDLAPIAASVTPSRSPTVLPKQMSLSSVPELIPTPILSNVTKRVIRSKPSPLNYRQNEDLLPSKKRVCHGFSLSY